MSNEGSGGSGGEGNQNDQKTLEERLVAAEERASKAENSNERLLNQSKEWKDKAQKASADDEERKKAAAAQKESEAEARGEYKKLLEQQKLETEAQRKRADDSDAKAKETRDTLLEARKLSAFENRLGGRLKNDKYLGFVNTRDILVDPDTGDIDTSSVDGAVKGFLGEHKELVNFSAGKMPNFQGGKGEHITDKQFSGMDLKNKRDNLSKIVEADTKRRKKNR